MIEELSSIYSTPFYLLDEEIVQKRVEYLKKELGSDIALVYAVKANTFLIPSLINHVARFELCSFGEYEIARDSKVPSSQMVISGVYKDEASLTTILKECTPEIITIESLNQWNLVKELSHTMSKSVKVLLRLTSNNQFGMSKSDIDKILKEIPENITIAGLEYFSKTQRHSLPILEQELMKLNEYMLYLEDTYHISLPEFEYGPGFPVFYFEDESFDEKSFLTGFKNIISKIKNRHISLELGRSIAACAGTYVTKIVDLKENKTGKYALCDGGINHLVYYGSNMAMRTPHHEIIPNKKGDDTYILVGALCTINDILMKELKATNLEVGDLIIFKNTGAYSLTEGISLFLSRNLPKVLLKTSSGVILLRDTFETQKLNNPNERKVVL